MALLGKKAATCVVTGLASLLFFISNPHFNGCHSCRPEQAINECPTEYGYPLSGSLHTTAYALIWGSGIGLGYLALTGKLKKDEEE